MQRILYSTIDPSVYGGIYMLLPTIPTIYENYLNMMMMHHQSSDYMVRGCIRTTCCRLAASLHMVVLCLFFTYIR